MVQGQAASSARALSFPVEREKERKKGKRRGRGSISFRVPATFGVHTATHHGARCQHATSQLTLYGIRRNDEQVRTSKSEGVLAAGVNMNDHDEAAVTANYARE